MKRFILQRLFGWRAGLVEDAISIFEDRDTSETVKLSRLTRIVRSWHDKPQK